MDDLKKQETAEYGWYEMVKEFHIAFGHPAPSELFPLTDIDRRYRATWLAEEMIEFVLADDLVEQTDAILDLIYFALGTLVSMGVEPQGLFEAIHTSNMQKLGPDGKPIYDPITGKILKPYTWEDPRNAIKQILLKRMDDMKDDDIPF